MSIAYLLINCELGYEKAVIEQLRQLDHVKEITSTFGSFDILAKLVSPSPSELNNIISKKIRKIKNIRGTLTLIGIDGQE